MLKRVLVTGDFLRPRPGLWAPSQHFNIRWLQQLLSTQIRLATGITPELLAWGDHSVDGGLRTEDISKLYHQMAAPETIDGWASICRRTDVLGPVEQILAEYFSDTFLIGFELPEIIEAAAIRHGATVIDVAIHPARFMDDIFFGLRSSDPVLNAKIARYAVDEREIELMAGLQSAAAQRNMAFAPVENSLLFLMQVREDRSQLSGAGFVEPADFEAELTDLFARYEHVYIKPHPFQKNPDLLEYLADLAPSAEESALNFYSLIATSQIKAVGSFSSSASYEAAYFGKETGYILGPPNTFAVNGAVPSGRDYVGVYDGFLSTGFWADILGDHFSPKAAPSLKPPFKPNRLRSSLKSDWGFSEIDTDFLAEKAVARRLEKVEERFSNRPSADLDEDEFPLDLTRWMRTGARAEERPGAGFRIRAGGKAEHVVFGPYISPPKGKYRLRLECEFPEARMFSGSSSRPVHLEIIHSANQVLASSTSDAWRKTGRTRDTSIDFEVAGPSGRTFEFRIWADEVTSFDIDHIWLERL